MDRRASLLAIGLSLILQACSTPYQEMGFAGGVTAAQMTSDTYRISARGNGWTSNLAVQDYVLLKAAETAKQSGGTHFIIVSAADASRVNIVSSPGQVQTSVVGNTAYSTYSPPTQSQIYKPGSDLYIRVFNIAPGQAPPPGAQSADEIITFVGSRVKRNSN